MRVRASQEPDADTETMSLEEAERTLDVSRSAGFETIMRAKESQTRKAGQDQEKVFRVRSHHVASAVEVTQRVCPLLRRTVPAMPMRKSRCCTNNLFHIGYIQSYMWSLVQKHTMLAVACDHSQAPVDLTVPLRPVRDAKQQHQCCS